MSPQVLSENRSQFNVAQQRIDSFLQRFGEAHFTFACHAAFPIALTPELLYAIWANFQQDSYGNALDIPWIVVSDFLLSSLCDEAGQEIYEMDQTTRDSLLYVLKGNASLGQTRIQQLAQFLETHVKPKLQSDDPDIRDWAQAQRWTALAYQKPEVAARELAIALSNAYKADRDDLIRLTTLVETLRNPLAIFKELIAYARGMAAYARGDLETAAHQFAVVNQTDTQGMLSEASVPDLQTTTSKRDSQGKAVIKKASKSLRRQSLALLQVAKNHWPILTATTITAVVIGFVSGSSSNQLITGLNDVNSNSFFTLFNPLAEPQPEPLQSNVPDTVSSGENATTSSNQNSVEISATESVTEITTNDGDSNNTQGNEANCDVNNSISSQGAVSVETVSFFQTPRYSVRIISCQDTDGLLMNAYNRATGIQEQNGVPVRVLSSGDGAITYASDGAINGLPATYIARIFNNNIGELQIVNANGSTILQETGTITTSNLSPGQFPPEQETTIIRFQGPEFATHVLEQGGGLFMNVHDRQADETILNRQRAFIEAPRNESDAWRSYLSFGSYRGVSATFTARVSPQGQAQLEIATRNTGQLLAVEDSNLIARQTTNLLTNTYAVVIPGGQNALARVRQFYPEAYLDSSGQSEVVNAGTFGNRNAAFARTYALRARSIDAQVIYRGTDQDELVPLEAMEIVIRAVSSTTRDYIVAAPGGQDVLIQVRELYPEAYQDRAEQENFVNVGNFSSQAAAIVRAYTLRAFGVNALVYQQPSGE